MHCICHVLSSAALPLARRLRQALTREPWRGPSGHTLAECRLSAPRRFAAGDCRSFASIGEAARQAGHVPQIFVGATGIAVRAMAPLLTHKSEDAPVLVISPDGRFVISLLAGHWGGGNSLCRHVAALLGATPVITTATDCEGRPALDLVMRTAGLRLLDWGELPPAQARWLEGGLLPLYDPCGIMADQAGFVRRETVPEGDGPAVCVHWRRVAPCRGRVRATAPVLVLGVGCRKGVAAAVLATAVEGLLLRHGLEPRALAALATITEKAQEPALRELARRLDLPLLTFEAAELAALRTPSPSAAAGRRFGCAPFSVCEASCLLAARRLGAGGRTTGEGPHDGADLPEGSATEGRDPAERTLPAVTDSAAAPGDGGRSPVPDQDTAESEAHTAAREDGEGADVPLRDDARLLVEKTKVAGQLTLAVALMAKKGLGAGHGC